MFNNRIYGLTKGQASPTSEFGKITKSSPYGTIDYPVSPLAIALAAEASFIARTVDTHTEHIQATLEGAGRHHGSAFVEVLQNCNIFSGAHASSPTARSATTGCSAWSTASRCSSGRSGTRGSGSTATSPRS
jgi:2-oxoglutarate ferredoxin oxidoreductase subunit beta